MKILTKVADLLRRAVFGVWYWWSRRRLVRCVETELLDEFLELLLEVVGLALRFDASYRRNVEGFRGRYVFRSEDGVVVSAVFENGRLAVHERAIPDPDINVCFKNGGALCRFLLSKNPDVFAFVLGNKLSYEGNLNYVLKFGYLAKRLELELGI